MKMLKVIDIKKIYGKGENEIKAVDGITLEIEPHKFSAIIGQSGSGKSTLLHCMAGLDKPTLGNVFMDNLDLYTLSDEKLSNLRSKEFGFIFQNYNLIPVINVYDNIVLPILIAKGKIDNNYINDLITKLGLESQINKFPNELSGGQQQRVAIARALATRPAIILADEPTGNLDSKTSDEVMSILKSMSKKYSQTLVMITHDDSIAQMADRVIFIEDGRVSKVGDKND